VSFPPFLSELWKDPSNREFCLLLKKAKGDWEAAEALWKRTAIAFLGSEDIRDLPKTEGRAKAQADAIEFLSQTLK
jgi:hypothetical protein